MDYKTTSLSISLFAEDEFLPEYEALKFAMINENRALFDYTQYFKNIDAEEIPYKVFMRSCKREIENYIKSGILKSSEIFYEDANSHVFVAAELAAVFLSFVDSDIFLYFNKLIMDAMTAGVAFSNGFIYELTTSRVSTPVLKEIISDRIKKKE